MREQADTVTIVAHDAGGIGGMERQLQALISRLVERGTSVLVVSRTLDLPPHPRLSWRRIPGPSRPFALAYPWFALWASVVLVVRRRGVLHTTGAIVLNHADVCTVHYLHNGAGGAVRRERRSTFLYRLNGLAARAMSRGFERAVFRSPAMSSILIAVSMPLAKELAGTFPARKDSIRVIPNGVDTERFRPDADARRDVRQELGLTETDKLALFVGSEWGRKGLEIAVQALREAGRRGTWPSSGVGSRKTEMTELAHNGLGFSTRLHLVGETASPRALLRRRRRLPNSQRVRVLLVGGLRGCCLGLPVIATDVGAIGEVGAGGGGLFVDRDAEAFGEALRKLEASPQETAAMASRARKGRGLRMGRGH